MFPGEDEFKRDVSADLGDWLNLGFSTATLGLEIITERHATVDWSQDPFSYRVGHGLCVRACKLLRSCLELAILGCDTEVTILSRSLFETLVATNFVLIPQLTIKLLGKPVTGLSRNDRGKIYRGFQYVDRLRTMEKAQKHSAASVDLQSFDTANLKAAVAEVEADLGTNWIKQFDAPPRTYSGMNLRELSDTIGEPCSGYYGLLYGHQSKSIHGADSDAQVHFSEQENRFVCKWYRSPAHFRTGLVLATAMLWGCLDLLHKAFQFDGDTDSKLQFHLATLSILSKVE